MVENLLLERDEPAQNDLSKEKVVYAMERAGSQMTTDELQLQASLNYEERGTMGHDLTQEAERYRQPWMCPKLTARRYISTFSPRGRN